MSMCRVIFVFLEGGICYDQCILLAKLCQARIVEWVAISFSRESSRPRNRNRVSYIAGRFFTNWAIREALILQSKESKRIRHDQLTLRDLFGPGLFVRLKQGKDWLWLFQSGRICPVVQPLQWNQGFKWPSESEMMNYNQKDIIEQELMLCIRKKKSNLHKQ